MATWNWGNGTLTYGGVDFSKPHDVLALELGLDSTGTKKLLEMAVSANDAATREQLLRKILNVALTIGEKAAQGGISVASILA